MSRSKRWKDGRGGESVNYHSISDFRKDHVAFLDQLPSDSVAALVHEGLVTLNRVAQDGDESRDKKKEPKPPRVSSTDPEAHVMKMADGLRRAQSSHGDQGQMLRMIEQHEDRYQQTPNQVLVDGGFAKISDIVIADWRQRMNREPAKTIYKDRASTAECVNATARNRGLYQFLLRGLEKVKAVALLFALAHNLARAVTLRRQLAATAG